MLVKFVGTVKILRSVRDSTQLGLNSKKRVFQCLVLKGIKYWDVRDHEQFEIRPVRDPSFIM